MALEFHCVNMMRLKYYLGIANIYENLNDLFIGGQTFKTLSADNVEGVSDAIQH